LAPLLAVVYIGPFAKVGNQARQGGTMVRMLALFALTLAAGCSTWPFARSSSDEVPPEAVRAYARAHGLSRDEARRELTMFREADVLKELRQQKMTNDQVPMTNHAGNRFWSLVIRHWSFTT
jgi:hypothetical protein